MNKNKQPDMLSFTKDLPNVCSLVGLFCTVLAIYFVIGGQFSASVIAILWSVLFDWYDGIIARKMKGRTKEQGEFGMQFDSIIDIVSFGVYPAILLLSYGNYEIWFIPGGFVIIAACAIRLSYFNIYGLIDSKTYRGLSVDNNVLILAFVFLFEEFIDHTVFSILMYAVLLILATFNLSSIPIPKFSGKWVYVLIIYVLVLTLIFGKGIYNQILT